MRKKIVAGLVSRRTMEELKARLRLGPLFWVLLVLVLVNLALQ